MAEIDEDKEKKELFLRCYDLIQQGKILFAGTTLSMLSTFALKDFFDFCNQKDLENGKQKRETVDKFTKTIAENT